MHMFKRGVQVEIGDPAYYTGVNSIKCKTSASGQQGIITCDADTDGDWGIEIFKDCNMYRVGGEYLTLITELGSARPSPYIDLNKCSCQGPSVNVTINFETIKVCKICHKEK